MNVKSPPNSRLENWLSSFLIALLPMLFIWWLTSNDVQGKDYDAKLNLKADKIDVENQFKTHAEANQIVFCSINSAILEIKQNNKDARNEYLVQIQLLRKDILDLYRSK